MNKSEKQALVAECRASGMTAKAWCEAKGIQYRQYVGWASKINRELKQQELQQWADVTISKEEYTTDEIKLRCGKWTIYVEAGFNPGLLGEILKVVDAVC